MCSSVELVPSTYTFFGFHAAGNKARLHVHSSYSAIVSGTYSTRGNSHGHITTTTTVGLCSKQLKGCCQQSKYMHTLRNSQW